MKLLEEINHFRKDWVFSCYVRIIEKFKDYEKISKVKMVKEVFALYDDYQNIINICTLKELKFLKKVIERDKNKKDDIKVDFTIEDFKKRIIPLKDELESSEYDFEITNLRNKFLIYNVEGVKIPEEIYDKVVLAVNNYKLPEVKRNDELNEILVGICKVYSNILPNVLAQIAMPILNISLDELQEHVYYNPLFNYFVYTTKYEFESIGKEIIFVLHDDYYLLDEYMEQTKKYGMASSVEFDIRKRKIMYQNFFYHDFNIENKKVFKLLEYFKEKDFMYRILKDELKRVVDLNLDIEYFLEYANRFDFALDEKLVLNAVMEIPSASLNGLTRKEVLKLQKQEKDFEKEKIKNYKKQENACLSRKNAKLFYKLYFALLEYTNNKYKINPSVRKIYKQEGINPYDIFEIIDKLWEDKDVIFPEFILKNPFRFDKDELKLVKEMQNGFREIFVIIAFEDKYTVVVNEEKTYMIKGLNANIDEIISIDNLPYVVTMTLIPFKGCLTYDGLFSALPIDMGVSARELFASEYKNSIKYYHL